MTKPRSHYDNLKVAKNAPPEVIRAAYKALAQNYHPDRNPGKEEICAKIMAIINHAYEVLSDPVQRRQHDEWIREQEAKTKEEPPPAPEPQRQQPPPRKAEAQSLFGLVFRHVGKNWYIYGIVAFICFVVTAEPPKPKPGPKPYVAQPVSANEHDFRGAVNPFEVEGVPAQTKVAATSEKKENFFDQFDTPDNKTYVRPRAAPNGQPWPKSADYVAGYPLLHANGLSSVTIDNTKNDSDVFIKLVSLSGANAYPVRHVFIPAHSKLALNNVKAGSYDIRYRNLNNGSLSRSESFQLAETETYEGTRFSNMTMTLYKVADGNMHTYSLPEGEF